MTVWYQLALPECIVRMNQTLPDPLEAALRCPSPDAGTSHVRVGPSNKVVLPGTGGVPAPAPTIAIGCGEPPMP